MKLRLLLLGLFVSLFVVIAPSRVFASEYYNRDYKVLYTVKDDGLTNVSIDVTLTNKTGDYYAVSDTLTLSFNDVTNVTAKDPDGTIKPVITKNDTGNEIESPFTRKVVGKGKSLVYNVSFDTTDIARHSGKIWEINIPGLSSPDIVDGFNAEVKVPDSFGKPTFVKPHHDDDKLIFSKEELAKSSISITYGTEQLYSFTLNYHLRNSNVFPIKTEIALPPSTNYQEVAILSMDPRPKDVIIDKDGNWLAQFDLAPAQRIDVTVKGQAKLTNTPRKESLSSAEIAEYTKDRTYWESTNTQIVTLAKQLKTPKAIYDYVVKNLEYDFNRVGPEKARLGAVQTLSQKNAAVCLEFTDLFIAIARAAGIPAREINGYAYTENSRQRPLSLVQDILHAWPEYYDTQKQAWVMIDPTWSNTTGGTDYFDVFDFDHFVFIRKGVNSQYPIPAGGYKHEGDENKKDIYVQFGTTFPTDLPEIKVIPDFPDKVFSGLPITGHVTIKNTGNTLFPKKTAVLSSTSLMPRRQEIAISPVPPFGMEKLEMEFNKTPFFSSRDYDFTFNLQDTIIQRHVKVSPFTFTRNQLIGGIIIVILAFIIPFTAYKAWGLFISRQR